MKHILRGILFFLVLLSSVLLAYKPMSETQYPLVGDEYVHIALGTYILEEGKLPFENPYLVGDAPHANFESGFHVLLAGLFTLFGDDPVTYYNKLAILFLVINSILLFYLVRVWTSSYYPALFAMFFFGTIKSTGGFLVHHYFLPLTVGITLLLLVYILFERYQMNFRTRSLSVLGILFVLMAVTYPPAFFFCAGTLFVYLLTFEHTLHEHFGLSKKRFVSYIFATLALFTVLLGITVYILGLQNHLLLTAAWDVVHIRLSPIFHLGFLASLFAVIGLASIAKKEGAGGKILVYWVFFGLVNIYLFNVLGASLFLPYPRLFMFYLTGVSIAAGIGFAEIIRRIRGNASKLWRSGIAVMFVLLIMSIQLTYAFRDSVRHPSIMTDAIHQSLTFLKQQYDQGVVIADGVTSLGVYPAIQHKVVGLLSSNIGGGDAPEAARFLTETCEEKKLSLHKLRHAISLEPDHIPHVTVLSGTPQTCDFLKVIQDGGPYLYEIREDIVAEALQTYSTFTRILAPVPPENVVKPPVYTLQEEELQKVVIGSTITNDMWTEYYDPSGDLVGYFSSTPGELGYRGFWIVRGDVLCTHFLDDTGSCMTISIRDKNITFYGMDGSIQATGTWQRGREETFDQLY